MAAQEFYKLKDAEKAEIFTAVAQQKGLPVYALVYQQIKFATY